MGAALSSAHLCFYNSGMNSKHLICTCLFLFALGMCSKVDSQENHYSRTVQAVGLGGSLVAQARNPAAIFWNPSLLAALKDRELFITVNDLFEFNELSVSDFYPAVGTIGFAFSRVSTDTSNIDGGALAWGRRFTDWLTIGSRFSFDKQGSTSFVSGSWGLLLGNPRFGTFDYNWKSKGETVFRERFNLGVSFQDIPIRRKLFDFSTLLGVSYLFPRIGFLLNAGYHIQKGKNTSHFGVGYQVTQHIKILSGISEFDPDEFGLGLGYTHDNLSVNFAYSAIHKRILFSVNTRISSSPKDRANPYLRNGKTALQDRNYRAAKRNFNYYLAYDIASPTSDSVRSIVEVLSNRIARNKTRVDSLLMAALTYLSSGEPKYLRAAYLYNRVLEMEPENEIANSKLNALKPIIDRNVKKFIDDGIAKFETEQYSEAKKQFNRVLIFDPSNTTAHDYLTKIEQTFTDLGEEYFYRGVGYYRQRNYKQAQKEFTTALSYNPNLSEAKSYLTKAKARISDNRTKIMQLLEEARVLEKRKKYYDATNKYLAVLALDRANNVARSRITALRPQIVRFVKRMFNEGVDYYRHKNYKKAENIFRRVLTMEPKHKAAKQNLVKLLEEKDNQVNNLLSEASKAVAKNDFSKASKYYSQAEVLDPGNKNIVTGRKNIETKRRVFKLLKEARKKFKEHKYLQAIDYYENVLTIDSQNTVVKNELVRTKKALNDAVERHFNYGIQLYTQDKYEKAIKVMDDVLRVQPNHEGAMEYKKQAIERLKALKKLNK